MADYSLDSYEKAFAQFLMARGTAKAFAEGETEGHGVARMCVHVDTRERSVEQAKGREDKRWIE